MIRKWSACCKTSPHTLRSWHASASTLSSLAVYAPIYFHFYSKNAVSSSRIKYPHYLCIFWLFLLFLIRRIYTGYTLYFLWRQKNAILRILLSSTNSGVGASIHCHLSAIYEYFVNVAQVWRVDFDGYVHEVEKHQQPGWGDTTARV